ncbi:M15 family metallopeptidase [Eudoraea chungangensis]|uniref:M15 family metallopeptidase n=1 Tax=Eudoraea chungangensis TaxID=1481905 RepID=UPI0023EB3AE0|nr:M15 family metallopeptidase [Eudoraea chungangensis]
MFIKSQMYKLPFLKGVWILLFLFAFPGCKESDKRKIRQAEKEIILKKEEIIEATPKVDKTYLLDSYTDTTFIRLADFSDDFSYDLRYATTNNFLKAKVYPCGECYTRVKTAKALISANKEFIEHGFRIKFFDCYRPNAVQYKMWELVPNPQYVANPVKGSIHNKGGAVDISLVGLKGEFVDMGTDFDYFGKRAYHDNTNLPEAILENRKLLKEIMEKYGFWSIRTEWWHYNLQGSSKDPIANFLWPCEEDLTIVQP